MKATQDPAHNDTCLNVKPTNDPKDAQDVGGKDDQQVDEREQNEGNGDVTGPVERLVGKHHLLDRSPHLIITANSCSTFDGVLKQHV